MSGENPNPLELPSGSRVEHYCEWQHDSDHGCWHTGCGNSFVVSDGTPAENKMKFCCYCGLQLEEKRRVLVQAKDLKPGWWFSHNDELRLCVLVSGCGAFCAFRYSATAATTGWVDYHAEVTHHPECTGWDWPIPKNVKLEVGKRYVMRNRKLTKSLRRKDDPVFVWHDGWFSWTARGRCWDDDSVNDTDIVAEYVEPEPVINPGEGWRLLADEETIREGDHYYSNRTLMWEKCISTVWCNTAHAKDSHNIKAFRRRIAPVYLPFTQETFAPHRDRWIARKTEPKIWMRVDRVEPPGVLIGNLWAVWSWLLSECEFQGGGVCGVEKHG